MTNTEKDNKGNVWKKKYFDSLKELENSEQNWEKIEDLLRLGISRLALISDTADDQKLNDQIQLLRKSIREGTESSRLVLLIENIAEDIKKLPDESDKSNKETKPAETNTNLIQLLETILDSIEINSTQNSLKTKFQSLLTKSDENDSDKLLTEFSSLVNSLIETKTSDVINDNSETDNLTKETEEIRDAIEPLVERRNDNRVASDLDTDIDRSIDSKKNALVAPAVGELILQLMTRFPPSFSKLLNENELARAASSARNRKDLLQIIDKISQELSQFIRKMSSKNGEEDSSDESDGEILIHLLQRISLPDELSEQVTDLKKEIEKGDSKSITNMVEATADLIMQMRVQLQAEKQELEQFLSEISKHLKALDIDIQITSRLRDESKESLKEYDEELENEVRGLETSINNTDEMAGLKQLVTERVKTIRLHMGAFRRSEEQRNNTADLTIKKLTSRISDMEQETLTLREAVKREHNNAVRDALTNIPNRLAYEDRIDSEFERCRRYKSSMAFVIWDIDHFKGINDHYGHIAGDKVLSVIAEVLKKNLRAADFIARYGGEEFVVIMPETTIDDAEKGCEKIRLAIENCNFHYRDTSVPITASCGFTTFTLGDSKESLFNRADKALYSAKGNGRNQCVRG